MRKICIIPARLESSRFPGKPLFRINGKPMIQWVYEACEKSNITELYVATPNKEIIDFCISKSFKYIKTSHSHQRGLDRIFEAYNSLEAKKDDDLIICMQGDEPLVVPSMINKIISFHEKTKCDFTVTGLPINDEEFHNHNIVKIAHDDNYKTIYTSRSPIPYSSSKGSNHAIRIFGLYTLTPKGLHEFHYLPPNRLEILESCDTNRILGSDLKQYVCIQKFAPQQQSVDTLNDAKNAENYLKKIQVM